MTGNLNRDFEGGKSSKTHIMRTCQVIGLDAYTHPFRKRGSRFLAVAEISISRSVELSIQQATYLYSSMDLSLILCLGPHLQILELSSHHTG